MGFTVMVLDGDAVLRALVTEVLEDESYTVRGYTTLQEAQRALAIAIPDLLILDGHVLLPPDTVALVYQFRLERATYDLPILAYSADPRFMQREGPRLRTLGCAVLAKPFALNDLLSQIETLLSPGAAEQARAVGQP